MDKFEESLKKIDKTKPAVPVPLDYFDELERIWGKKWGAQNEIGKLRELIVHKPGSEIVLPKEDLKWYGMKSVANVDRGMEQHDKFVETLRNEKVTVHYLNPATIVGPYSHLQGLWGTRDFGVVVNGGAIVGRMSLPWDKGAETSWAKKVIDLGCPILHTVRGSGTFEGGDVIWLDPAHVCVGRSIRTNQEGIDQVSMVLRSVGVLEIKVVPIPGWLENIDWPAGGFSHLDAVFSYVDTGLGLIYPSAVPFDFLAYLKEKEVNLIEAPAEEVKNYACNVLVIEEGKIIMLEGNQLTKKKLETEGVDVITVDMGEIVKIGGGPHCASSPLIRDPGPRLG